jgi:hypothetical protein
MSPHTVWQSLFPCDRASIAQHAVIPNLFWRCQPSAQESYFPSDAEAQMAGVEDDRRSTAAFMGGLCDGGELGEVIY